MTTLRKYQTKDGPAGSSIDFEAKILSANLKISYSEAMQLAILQNPALAETYIDNSVETRSFSSDVKQKGTGFDEKCREYMKEVGCSYSSACTEMLKRGHTY